MGTRDGEERAAGCGDADYGDVLLRRRSAEGERVTGAFTFRRFGLTTGSGSYDLAVPTGDVETVRYALGVAV
ncbi:hypothetical protein BGM09_16105 [Streptomyces sp. CBMA29]|nr:hypothetical protein [Streptomyces sp. CBMA29]